MATEDPKGQSIKDFKALVEAAVQRAIGARSIETGSITAGVMLDPALMLRDLPAGGAPDDIAKRITEEIGAKLPGTKLTPVVVRDAGHVTAGFRMD